MSINPPVKIVLIESNGRETVLASVVGEVTRKPAPDPLWFRSLAGFVRIGWTVTTVMLWVALSLWGGSYAIKALGLAPEAPARIEETAP